MATVAVHAPFGSPTRKNAVGAPGLMTDARSGRYLMPENRDTLTTEKLLAERTALIEEMKRIEKRVWAINLALVDMQKGACNAG